MKLSEELRFEDGNLVVKQTHDFAEASRRARLMRDAGKQNFGESRFIGTVTRKQVLEWCKEAGVKSTDNDAVSEVIKRKLLSNEFRDFRVWGGTY